MDSKMNFQIEPADFFEYVKFFLLYIANIDPENDKVITEAYDGADGKSIRTAAGKAFNILDKYVIELQQDNEGGVTAVMKQGANKEAVKEAMGTVKVILSGTASHAKLLFKKPIKNVRYSRDLLNSQTKNPARQLNVFTQLLPTEMELAECENRKLESKKKRKQKQGEELTKWDGIKYEIITEEGGFSASEYKAVIALQILARECKESGTLKRHEIGNYLKWSITFKLADFYKAFGATYTRRGEANKIRIKDSDREAAKDAMYSLTFKKVLLQTKDKKYITHYISPIGVEHDPTGIKGDEATFLIDNVFFSESNGFISIPSDINERIRQAAGKKRLSPSVFPFILWLYSIDEKVKIGISRIYEVMNIEGQKPNRQKERFVRALEVAQNMGLIERVEESTSGSGEKQYRFFKAK
jgi:hypothetical protein